MDAGDESFGDALVAFLADHRLGSPADFSLADRVACGLWQSEHSGAFSLPLRTSAECTLSSYCLTVFLWQSRQVSMRSSELARLLAIALGCLPWSFKSISE